MSKRWAEGERYPRQREVRKLMVRGKGKQAGKSIVSSNKGVRGFRDFRGQKLNFI